MRKIIKAVALGALLVASLTSPSAAAYVVVTLGSVMVRLVLPANFCELSPTRPSDAAFVARQKAQLAQAGLQFLSISATSSELAAWRLGLGLLNHYIVFSADDRFITQPTPVDPETMRKQICDTNRKQAQQAISAAMAMGNSRPENIARNIKMNSAAPVNVDDNDPNACHIAVLQKLQTQLGTEKLQLMIDTTVAIKGKILFASLFIPYTDMDGVTKSLAENREFVAGWRATNGM